MTNNTKKPLTHQADLTKLPSALAPLIERPQWCVWRWTLRNGVWQKPPYQALQPDCHASSTDLSTCTDYEAALDAVQTRRADGITYMLTEADPFAAIDVDHCRDVGTHSIDAWAQNFLDVGRRSYSEITPSGTGLRIWGLASGNKVHNNFRLEIDGKLVAAELFRRTNKPLTITGSTLNPAIRELANIDRVIDWAVIWGERRKAAAAAAAPPIVGNGFNGGGNGSGYSVAQIEQIAREGAPAGENRSDTFHVVVGHYLGCDWSAEQIYAHLQQFPDGIGGRYLHEGRLSGEIARSAGKYSAGTLPQPGANGWVNGFQVKAPAPSGPDLPNDPELDDGPGEEPAQNPASDPELDDDLLDDDLVEDDPPRQKPEPEPDDPDEELDGELNEGKAPVPDPNLPPLYAHGDPDPRPIKDWAIKHFMPVSGHGLLAGQWGAGKTFAGLDLSAALMTGQPFLGHVVKRQCGVLFIAAEGANEVRLRLDAVIREKCGGMQRAPFRWYETAPLLLQKGSAEKLIAMARQANASLQAEFGLPLGLIIIDTVAACAGYDRPGAENDPAVGQALMNVLKEVAQNLNCFVLGVDHFGKNLEAGTRGASSKEASSDLVLVCLGEKDLSGSVTDTRLAVRKHRGGRQGQEYPFELRIVEAPEPDEDGEPVTTMVINWQSPAEGGKAGGGGAPPRDPWAESRRQDQRTADLRLKRVLMEILVDQGVDLPIPPDGPVVRMVDQSAARATFFAYTPAAEGTVKQQQDRRRAQFYSALERAEQAQLVGIRQIGEVTYLWLNRPLPEGEEDQK